MPNPKLPYKIINFNIIWKTKNNWIWHKKQIYIHAPTSEKNYSDSPNILLNDNYAVL